MTSKGGANTIDRRGLDRAASKPVNRPRLLPPQRSRATTLVTLGIFLTVVFVCLWFVTHSVPNTAVVASRVGVEVPSLVARSDAEERKVKAFRDVAGIFRPHTTGPPLGSDVADSDHPDARARTNVRLGHEGGPHSSLFGSLLQAAEPSEADLESYIRHRSVSHPFVDAPRSAILLIPVNAAYVEFGMNLLCSLLSLRWKGEDSQDQGRERSWLVGPNHSGFVFVAMDRPAHDSLMALNVPVVRDPDVPFITSKSAAWADPKFHSLVCTKLIPVIRVLKMGVDVILSDADVVFMKHFVPLLRSVLPSADRAPLSFLFSIGSCHKHLPNNLHMNEEKINTGFYYARAEPAVISVLERALQYCRGATLEGDQPAVNSIVRKDLEGHPDYSFGFFDGCLFSNGCTYFKHLCANNTYDAKYDHQMGSSGLPSELRTLYPKDEPVMVHANFLVGKKAKVRHLQKYGLWDTKCMLSVFGYEPPSMVPLQTTAQRP